MDNYSEEMYSEIEVSEGNNHNQEGSEIELDLDDIEVEGSQEELGSGSFDPARLDYDLLGQMEMADEVSLQLESGEEEAVLSQPDDVFSQDLDQGIMKFDSQTFKEAMRLTKEIDEAQVQLNDEVSESALETPADDELM